MKTLVTNFYPEEFRKKTDAEKYSAKGTCEVSIDIKNITYRIDHDGNIHLKPPFRIHSNKKAGIKPKLVPSIVFRDRARDRQACGQGGVLLKENLPEAVREKPMQLEFWA